MTAASDWDGPHERKRGACRPCADSYERAVPCHRHADVHAADCATLPRCNECCWRRACERAIGVIYRPETERQSHYFHAALPRQFDALIHIDTSSAVVPLDEREEPALREAAETYPTGL